MNNSMNHFARIESLETRAMMDASGMPQFGDYTADTNDSAVIAASTNDTSIDVTSVTRDKPTEICDEALDVYAKKNSTVNENSVAEAFMTQGIRDEVGNEYFDIGEVVNGKSSSLRTLSDSSDAYSAQDKYDITHGAAERWVENGRTIIDAEDARVLEEAGNVKVIGYLDGANKTVVEMELKSGMEKTEVFVWKEGSQCWAKESIITYKNIVSLRGSRVNVTDAYAYSSGIELEYTSVSGSLQFCLRNDYRGNTYTYKLVTTMTDGTQSVSYCSFKFGYTNAEIAQQNAIDKAIIDINTDIDNPIIDYNIIDDLM